MSSGSLSELTWEEYRKKLRGKSRDENIPYTANLELTPRCNFSCKMCYVHLTDDEAKKIGRERTAREWIDMGKQIFDSGTLMLLLTGGEVLLRPDFREIYEAYSEMGFVLSMFSNGYLLDEKVLSWLSKRPPSMLRVTLYGASNETYEKITGVKNAFDRVMKNVDNAIEAGIPMFLAATIVNENKNDLDTIRKIAEDRDLEFIYTQNIVKPVRGAKFRGGVTEVDKIRDIVNQHSSSRVEYIVNVFDDPFGMCSVRGCGFWITWDGKMSTCSFIDTPCSYPFESGFLEAWRELQGELKKIKKPEKCVGCKYAAFCMACPGEFCAETGRPDQVSERICGQARALYEACSLSYLNDINQDQ